MLVSVIVCTHTAERLADLADCIRSLKKQKVHDMEIIIVVDGNYHLHKVIKDRLEPIKVLLTPKRLGAFGAGNAGARVAQGEVVAFIDDDAEAKETWLEELLNQYDEDNAVAVGGPALPLWQKDPKHLPQELYWLVGVTPSDGSCEKRNTYGVNMSFRKSVLEKVGYLNGDLGFYGKRQMQGAEAELAIRVRKEYGKGMSYAEKAIVFHKVPESKLRLWALLRRAYWQGISKRKITRLHSEAELDTERYYLSNLLFKVIPGHVRRLELIEVFLDLAVIASVGAGYMIGIMYRR